MNSLDRGTLTNLTTKPVTLNDEEKAQFDQSFANFISDNNCSSKI